MWSTEISVNRSEDQFTHKSKMMALGSCFADEIGQRLDDLYFDIEVNPFGVLYNPVSLARSIGWLTGRLEWEGDGCFEHQGLWRHFDVHSRVSKTHRSEFVNHVNTIIEEGRAQLRESALVILTFGSSFVWEKSDGGVVANCHKLPASEFSRRMLTPLEIQQAIKSMIDDIHTVNKTCVILVTVSPVRHIRDGLVENSWSKARLLDSCRQIAESSKQVTYFPSYEIQLDELRDYRFYAEDMIHPSSQSVDHIFSKFFHAYFSNVPAELIQLIKKVKNNLKHRPFDSNSEAYHKHLKKTEELIRTVYNKYDIELK